MVRRGGDVVWRTAPGFLVLARPEGQLLTVTGPGAELWEALANPAELADVVTALAERYRASVDEVGRDLGELVRSLADQGFVEVV